MDSTLALTLGNSYEQIQVWNAADTEPPVDFNTSVSFELTFDGTTVTYDADHRSLTLENFLSFELSGNEHAMVFIVTPMHSVTVAGKTARLFDDEVSDPDNAYDIVDDMRAHARTAGRLDLTGPSFSGNDDSLLAVTNPPHMQHSNRRDERQANDPFGSGPAR